MAIVLLAYGGYHLTRWKHDTDAETRISRYNALIARYARAQSLEPQLVRAVIRCESGGDERATSGAGARGLMQITAVTEQELLRLRKIDRAGDPYDPDYNIRAGTLYLREMLNRFDQNVLLAVAAYNMGPTRLAALRTQHAELSDQQLVDQYAPPATQAYCRNVLAWRGRYQTSR